MQSIEILPSNSLFDEREHGKAHTPYEIEKKFYSCIKRGNVDETKRMITELLDGKVFVGRMSINGIRQMQYWAVSCIAIAIRYAIEGGLNETEAYNFADKCIMNIDAMYSDDAILEFLIGKGIELAEKVRDCKVENHYPKAVRKCIYIINTRLFSDLSLPTLANACGVSKDYLSALFLRSLGLTISKYIKRERLHAAKDMLESGFTISEAAYTAHFCSESYFIKCFKEEFGLTPKKYTEMIF